MMLFLYSNLSSKKIVSDLEETLTHLKVKTFKIRYTDTKGHQSKGTLIWDKTHPSQFIFEIRMPHQTTAILNQNKRIVMRVQNNIDDTVSVKDITDNPLSSIFKKEVKFVEHSDSHVSATGRNIGKGYYQVILHRFNDPEHKKDRIIVEYTKVKEHIKLVRWQTIMDNKGTEIEFFY